MSVPEEGQSHLSPWSLWSRLGRVAPPHNRLGSPCLVRGQTRDSLSRCEKCSELPSMFQPGAGFCGQGTFYFGG